MMATGSARWRSWIAGRPPAEDLLAQEGVEVHAAQPAVFVGDGRRLARLVVGDDQLAVGAEVEAVDDAAEA